MKVKLTKQMKEILTVAEMPKVRKLIEGLRTELDVKEYAEMAARIAGCSCPEVLKAEAEIAKNARVFNQYFEDSGNLDIWVRVYAFSEYDGFYIVGAYLTDIWASTGYNSQELRKHMYIRTFKEMK